MLRQRERARKALRNSHLTRAKIINLSSQSTLAALTRIIATVTPSWAPPHTWRLTRHIAKRAALPSHPPSRLRLFDAAPSVSEKQPQWVSQFSRLTTPSTPNREISPRDTRMIQQKRVPQSVALFLQVIPHCFQITRRSESREWCQSGEWRVESGGEKT